MSNYYVYIPSAVKKKINKIPLPWQNRVIKALALLQRDPYLGDKMRGEYAGYYKVKVWPYRIIYSVYKQKLIIEIVEIDHLGKYILSMNL